MPWAPSGAAAYRGAVRSKRADVLDTVADAICQLPADRISRVGVDGFDGAGKTTFADELATALGRSGRAVIRASVDGFHRPGAQRYGLGRTSPEGFFRDSYDYGQLRAVLLDPLSPGGDRRFRRAVFDCDSDSQAVRSLETAAPNAVLIVDGMFLHRPELRSYWDFSVFLEVGFAVSIPRGAQRGIGSPDPGAECNRRYIEGQRIYLRECTPHEYATVVIDNEDLSSPVIR